MPEDSLNANENEHTVAATGHDTGPAHHRLIRRPGRRTSYLLAGAIAVVGLGVVGAAVVDARPDRTASPTTVAIDDRAATADRADRSDREPILPTPGATTAAPTPTPSASPSPSRAAVTSTPKARPKTARATTKAKPGWVSPMPGAEITSCFGQRWGVLHAGIDLAEPAGTPIRAAGGGTVVNAGWDFAGYGISVVVDHGNGYLTHYAHQSKAAVRVGDRVTAGTVIGYEGSTGDSTGPHLHFEVHQGQLWNQIDPAQFMRSRGVDLGC